ncbi:hypothetical protein KVT40_001212 [Elsinoe batatas]|uniref:Uncharacterized protein n=1 Tax=Elsinoe batatas TaxID=2601811 RepID=A0A8K0PL07_9PEZI|nr:hypothetical protein KVT40_001212 [Elsinoe batatas]
MDVIINLVCDRSTQLPSSSEATITQCHDLKFINASVGRTRSFWRMSIRVDCRERRGRGEPVHDERVYIYLPVICSSAAMVPGAFAFVFPNPVSSILALALVFRVWNIREDASYNASLYTFWPTPGAASLCSISAHLYSKVAHWEDNDLAFDASAGSLQWRLFKMVGFGTLCLPLQVQEWYARSFGKWLASFLMTNYGRKAWIPRMVSPIGACRWENPSAWSL